MSFAPRRNFPSRSISCGTSSAIAPAQRGLEALRPPGESMTPTIHDSALLIVDRSQNVLAAAMKNGPKSRRRLASAPIFVFHLGEDLRLKRLRRIDDKFVAAISDNIEEFPVEVIEPGTDGALRIIGKVIWWDNRL